MVTSRMNCFNVGTADAPNRWLIWGTVSLPRNFVVSPATEWHTGFPYLAVDLARHYIGTPNDERFPRFFSLDMVVYRTVPIRDRKVDLGASACLDRLRYRIAVAA